MSNKETLQNNNTEFQSNNVDLQSILDIINTLPEEKTLTDLLPALSNPATGENIESGYEAIDGSGAVIAGSLNIPFKYVGSFEVQGSLVEFGGASRAIASISSISNLSGKLQKGKRYMLVLQGIGTVDYTSNCTIYGIAQMYTTSNTVSMSTLEFPDRFSVIAYKSDGVTHTHGANDTYLQMSNHSGKYLHVMNTAGYEGYLSYGYSSFNTPPTIDIYEM